jgi:hypothetical protein
MGIQDLPTDFGSWLADRELHLQQDLTASDHTHQLYRQYRVHLGAGRYAILRSVQGIIVPAHVRGLLGLKNRLYTRAALSVYKIFVRLNLDWLPKAIILPRQYAPQVRELEVG